MTHATKLRRALLSALGLSLATGIGSLALMAGSTTRAEAREYRWCAYYAGVRGDGGLSNCGFDTLAQCNATISGAGGRCAENPAYVGGEPRPRIKRRRYID